MAATVHRVGPAAQAGRFSALLHSPCPAASRVCSARQAAVAHARRRRLPLQRLCSGALVQQDTPTVRSGSYPFTQIEKEWQEYWLANSTYRTPSLSELDTSRPKFYALDMFPVRDNAHTKRWCR